MVVQVEENGLMAVTQQLAQIGAGAMGSDRATAAPPYAGLSLTPTLTPIGSPIQGSLPQQSRSFPGSPLQQQQQQSHDATPFAARRDLFQVSAHISSLCAVQSL